MVKLVERLVPRVLTSRETVVSPARNGWVAVYDEVAERDPDKLRALGRELSAASAHVKITIGVEYGRIVHLIAMDRGRLMDEYVCPESPQRRSRRRDRAARESDRAVAADRRRPGSDQVGGAYGRVAG